VVVRLLTFSAGNGQWTVACDGKSLRVKGIARRVRDNGIHEVDSFIPLHAITAARLNEQGTGKALLFLRVWDGEEFYIGVDHLGAREILEGLRALVADIGRINVAWPMSSARATAARSQIQAGALKDMFLLGAQGREEFWSPLSQVPEEWAHVWRASSTGTEEILAAFVSRGNSSSTLAVLTDGALVEIEGSGVRREVHFAHLLQPILAAVMEDSRPLDDISAPVHFELEVPSSSGVAIHLQRIGTGDLQPLFRFLLARWADREMQPFEDVVAGVTHAAAMLESGEVDAVGYAALIDAAIAHESGVELARHYPPRERQYLRTQPVAPESRAREVRQGAPSGSGITARQVVAGAAVGAAVWNLLAD